MTTEIERHRHEVNWLIRQRAERGPEWRDAYLAKVASHRGQASADALRRDAAQQWARGSRGMPGNWREEVQ